MSTADTTTSAPIRAHRPPLRSLLMMIRSETKMVLRDPAGLIVPLGLPLLVLVTSAGAAGDVVVANGRTALDLFVMPVAVVIVLAMVGVLNMPSFLAFYRRTGILRRLAVTPASPVMVLVAQVAVAILQSAVGIGLAAAVAVLAFGANAPVDVVPALGVLALAAAAMYAMGMIVAAIAPTPNSAVAIGVVAFLGLGATGGMFGGRGALPDPVAEIGAHLPFGAAVDALAATWAGTPVAASSVISLAGAVGIGVVIAGWLFRWE